MVFCYHQALKGQLSSGLNNTAQKMEFSIKDSFSKCDQSRLGVWSYLLRKSSIENFIFCAVQRNTSAPNSYKLMQLSSLEPPRLFRLGRNNWFAEMLEEKIQWSTHLTNVVTYTNFGIKKFTLAFSFLSRFFCPCYLMTGFCGLWFFSPLFSQSKISKIRCFF